MPNQTRRRSGDPQPKSLQASAARISLTNGRIARRQLGSRQDWQKEVWGYYKAVPEVRSGINYRANQLSKLRMFVGTPDPNEPDADPIAIDDPRSPIPAQWQAVALLELARLRSAASGRGELLRVASINLDLPGECFLVGEEVIADDQQTIVGEEWDIRSIAELIVEDDGIDPKTGEPRLRYKIKSGPNDQKGRVLDPAHSTVIRLWTRAADFAMLADSNMQAMRTECLAIEVLSALVIADANSRMNAGVFTVPSELTFGSDDPDQDDPDDPDADPLSDSMDEAFTEPIEDPSSSASVVPLILRGEAQYLDPKFLRHITFPKATDGTSLDERIEARILRLARGTDLPVEAMLGHQKTTFANAKQIDKDTWEKYLQPSAVRIVECFTYGFMRPNLAELQCPPEIIDQIVVWFDPAGVIGGPDPSTTADAALDKDAISLKAYRKATGWSEADAPEALEVLLRLLQKNPLPPQFWPPLINLLMPGEDVQPEALPGGSATVASLMQMLHEQSTTDAVVVPAPAELNAAAVATRPTRAGGKLLAIDAQLRGRLLTASDSAMTKALDRVGNRMRGQVQKNAELRQAIPMGTAGRHVPSILGRAVTQSLNAAGAETFDGAWDELKAQFYQWGAQAQEQAIDVAGRLAAGIPAETRAALKLRQADDLDTAWGWFEHALTQLADARLFSPDPQAPTVGEFDATATVPTGMIRRAMSIAGGRNDLAVNVEGDVLDAGAWVVLEPGTAAQGGIGNGSLIGEAVGATGASTDGYTWVYGNAYRANEFEPHSDLDGEPFATFDDPVLANTYGWPDNDFFIPGDHAGCICDFEQTIVEPDGSTGAPS